MPASLVNIPFYVGHNKNLNIIIVLRVILKGPPILMKILIKSGQVARISIYNVLFRNADNINESHHFTGFYLFLFYNKSLLFGFQPGTAKPHKMPTIITSRITSSQPTRN